VYTIAVIIRRNMRSSGAAPDTTHARVRRHSLRRLRS